MATKGQLSTKDLAEYVVGRVRTLARAMRAKQEPQYFKGRDAETMSWCGGNSQTQWALVINVDRADREAALCIRLQRATPTGTPTAVTPERASARLKPLE